MAAERHIRNPGGYIPRSQRMADAELRGSPAPYQSWGHGNSDEMYKTHNPSSISANTSQQYHLYPGAHLPSCSATALRPFCPPCHAHNISPCVTHSCYTQHCHYNHHVVPAHGHHCCTAAYHPYAYFQRAPEYNFPPGRHYPYQAFPFGFQPQAASEAPMTTPWDEPVVSKQPMRSPTKISPSPPSQPSSSYSLPIPTVHVPSTGAEDHGPYFKYAPYTDSPLPYNPSSLPPPLANNRVRPVSPLMPRMRSPNQRHQLSPPPLTIGSPLVLPSMPRTPLPPSELHVSQSFEETYSEEELESPLLDALAKNSSTSDVEETSSHSSPSQNPPPDIPVGAIEEKDVPDISDPIPPSPSSRSDTSETVKPRRYGPFRQRGDDGRVEFN